jgi:hypothetical protein
MVKALPKTFSDSFRRDAAKVDVPGPMPPNRSGNPRESSITLSRFRHQVQGIDTPEMVPLQSRKGFRL